jgi:hypothetical protein
MKISAFVLLSYVATSLPTSGLTHLTTGGVAKAAINFNHAPTYINYHQVHNQGEKELRRLMMKKKEELEEESKISKEKIEDMEKKMNE